MNFVSPGFALFLSIVFLLYWFVFKKNTQSQNVLLLVASLFFYTWFNWRFSGILVFSILLNFYIGKLIQSKRERPAGKWWLSAGLIINLGIFFCFKYFNFFNIVSSDNHQGSLIHSSDILLPLGISFYTFQVLGYIIDVSNEEIGSCNDLLAFSTYVAYFPKIASGPIEPAKKFLPQIEVKRNFDYTLATDGMRQILWGVFTKIVVANNCASFAQPVFENHTAYPGSTLLVASFFYLFQVYCDFSGYSNIAIGVSKLFGIQLSRNFHAPFFSTTIREYWQKWHITLTSWMMKYVFTPLSFSLRHFKKAGTVISIIITFLIVGLWHGTEWTFIVFGLLHGIYFIPLLLFPKNTEGSGYHRQTAFFKLTRFAKMLGLFLIIMFTCIFFGSDSLTGAIGFINKIFSGSVFSSPVWPPYTGSFKTFITVIFILILLTTEWIQQSRSHELQLDHLKNLYLRQSIYIALILAILLFGSVMHINFLYSRF
jgi:D-alanyl-lipoteichoic acid acyltransferase DltB (MBOAT superfamily)